MRKLLFCVTLLLLTNALARGQGAGESYGRLDSLKAEAARLLESQANRERAWGAYLAGRNGLDGLEPALVQTLADPALADGPEEKIVRQAALDALIRLGAKVPSETLRALPPAFSDEVVILLAGAPADNQAALLELFASMVGDNGPATHWLAAGNLLAETKAHGFAALLLRDLKVEADIVVLDWEGDYGFGSNKGGGCGCGFFHKLPEGFPPVSYYVLTTEAERDAVVIAPGKHPVFYRRSASPYGGCGSSSLPRVRDELRVEYLARLLDTSEDGLDFDARFSESVVCKDAKQCRRELAGVRGRIEQSYAALVGRLVEKGHLDGAGDAPAAPPLTFTLHDYRRRKSFPLPDRLKGVTILVENTESDAGAEDDAGAEAP
jgi:hypothetical protein